MSIRVMPGLNTSMVRNKRVRKDVVERVGLCRGRRRTNEWKFNEKESVEGKYNQKKGEEDEERER